MFDRITSKLEEKLHGQNNAQYNAQQNAQNNESGHGKLAAGLGALGLGAYLHGSGSSTTESDDGHGKLGVMGALGAAAAYLHHGKDSDSDSDDDHHGLLIAGGLAGVGALAFFYAMRKKKQRDYVVIVDASASMQSGVFTPLGATRWSETQTALNLLAAEACKSDPDGLTLYFFNDRVQRYNNIRSPADVNQIFTTFFPAGFTDLTSALDAAFQEHFGKAKARPTSILVIHDGEPNDEASVKVVLQRAANALKKKSELNVSFVQVGDDPKATAFLNHLDTGLGAKFDIVDTVKSTQLAGKSFSDAIGEGLRG